jgi:hypothetical protein
MTADPGVSAVRIVAAAEQHSLIGKATGGKWGDLSRELADAMNRISDGDLGDLERMLFGQAMALQSLFVRLTEGALSTEQAATTYDMRLRYAFRAQSQCRATLETLAAVKNPPVVFARQANLANGPQQINNHRAAHAGTESGPNELSGATIDLSANGEPSAPAGAPDSTMAPVGAIDRAAHRRRKEPILAQRMEGRNARHPSRGVQATKGSGARRARDRNRAAPPVRNRPRRAQQ